MTALDSLVLYLREHHRRRARCCRRRAARRPAPCADAGWGSCATRTRPTSSSSPSTAPSTTASCTPPTRRCAARRGDRRHEPRPVLPDARRRAARLRGDARRDRGVHRRPRRGGRSASRARTMGGALFGASRRPRRDDAALVGDRLATDVAMGQRVGMAGVLVLSGGHRGRRGPRLRGAAPTTSSRASIELLPEQMTELQEDQIMINFVFMLTHNDATVAGRARRAEAAARHRPALRRLQGRRRDADALTRGRRRPRTSMGMEVMLEVVSTSAEDERRLARGRASDRRRLGARRHQPRGGRWRSSPGRGIRYCPFPGTVVGHPSVLEGEIEEIADDAAALTAHRRRPRRRPARLPARDGRHRRR